jgi:hypothetical protein
MILPRQARDKHIGKALKNECVLYIKLVKLVADLERTPGRPTGGGGGMEEEWDSNPLAADAIAGAKTKENRLLLFCFCSRHFSMLKMMKHRHFTKTGSGQQT